MNKNIKYLSMVLLIGLMIFSGCNNEINNIQTQKNTQTLRDYFGQDIDSYYRGVQGSRITCLNGTCPDKTISSKLNLKSCIFCNDLVIGENEIEVNLAPINHADMYPGCSNKDIFYFPVSLEILEQTSEYIRARGIGNGKNINIGDNCKENYEYNYTTDEEWIFTTKLIENLTTIQVLSDSNIYEENQLIILANGYNKKKQEYEYSNNYVDVICENDFDINIKPYLRVIKINDINTTKYIQMKEDNNYYKEEPNKSRFYITADYNADYLVEPYCNIYGGAISEIKSNDKFILRVTNSHNGNYPN